MGIVTDTSAATDAAAAEQMDLATIDQSNTNQDEGLDITEFLNAVNNSTDSEAPITAQTEISQLDVGALADITALPEADIQTIIGDISADQESATVEDLFKALDSNGDSVLDATDSRATTEPMNTTDPLNTSAEMSVNPYLTGSKEGQIWGDPHFVGADGGKYDVQGVEGETYGIISDKHIAYNAKFTNPKGDVGVTYVGAVGITVDSSGTAPADQIQWYARNGLPLINGEEITASSQWSELKGGGGRYRYEGDSLAVENYARNSDGSFVLDNNGQKVAEYGIKLTDKGEHFDQVLYTGEKGVGMDGVAGHGLWGQTVDGDGQARSGAQGKGMQGQGAIEMIDEHGNAVMTKIGESGDFISQYSTDGLFDTTMGVEGDSDAFNRYGGASGEISDSPYDNHSPANQNSVGSSEASHKDIEAPNNSNANINANANFEFLEGRTADDSLQPRDLAAERDELILNPLLNGLSDDEIVERIAMEDPLIGSSGFPVVGQETPATLAPLLQPKK